MVLVAVVVPVDADAQECAAEELLADGTHVGEEPAVHREVAAEVGGPESAEAVLGVGNVAAERHVAAVVAQPTVSRVDAVVHDPRAVLVEAAEAGGGSVGNAAGGCHAHLAHLGIDAPAHDRDGRCGRQNHQ